MAIKLTNSEDGRKATFNEINITPLTDIFLVLLIIMMVIAPSFQSIDNNINMPEINSGISVEEKNATISVTKEGDMFLNGERATDENLEDSLVKIIDTLQEKQVVVRADKDTKSSEIMKIMRIAQNAGYEKLTVAGEPLSKKEQKKLQEENKEVEE
ncbi:biopolymer transporter ExbD [bacterium]|nr:biopolymer transporter ExbD [bacterium]